MSEDVATTRSEVEGDAQDPFAAAVHAALVPVTNGAHAPATLYNGDQPGGLLARIFEGREDRRHREAGKVIRNVTEEGLLATAAMGMLANGVMAAGLDTERGFQDTMLHHKDSAMAMAAAPALVQLARGAFTAGVSAVLQASVDHIRRKIANR